MAENKTIKNDGNVKEFLKSIPEDKKQHEAFTILNLMEKITGLKPAMWGNSIVGFGTYHYKYDSGREGDFFLTGFSPRKQNLTLYIMPGFSRYPDLMNKLGNYKTGKSCLYIKKLEDIDLAVLEELIRLSVDHMKRKYNI